MAYDRWSAEGRKVDALDRFEDVLDTILGVLLIPFVLVLVLIDRYG